ncbi:hypothetical protein A1Q2_01378 [Trichosporon asahii var. asahii CBS 8904]|uniref:DNA-directed RNA polymerase III subunit RPC9 n=2 Tax=Trichosporon asahii var. asahii TaxID=189963 RepID=K1VXV2_TRIAC|nr:hypothetical protein A1Q1_05406 [Trichosporon asahii var. asahii CBS 2479]EJT46076.1 hypothetical protein A1Q1_05406 [Trichosporon asahii var. asahii CBS 2479]EKD04347.1 hypothetical protein A1Q2_01378 [Trichosporon asahii var. asahii CBS 8904]
MKISNNPPQHLSNYEVLQHFIGTKKDNDFLEEAVRNHTNRQALLAREHLPPKKGAYVPDVPDVPDLDEEGLKKEDEGARRGKSDEAIWIQDEVIKYLCADFNVTARQTAEGVAQLADGLQDYGLTKAELLQVCNLGPRSQVGLYLVSWLFCVETDKQVLEDAEKRLPMPYEDTMNTIVESVIAPTILDEVPESLLQFVNTVQPAEIANAVMNETAEYAEDEEMYQEEEFVHEAEWGAAREGGVDDEEDNTMD